MWEEQTGDVIIKVSLPNFFYLYIQCILPEFGIGNGQKQCIFPEFGIGNEKIKNNCNFPEFGIGTVMRKKRKRILLTSY